MRNTQLQEVLCIMSIISPKMFKEKSQPTYRSITMDREEIELYCHLANLRSNNCLVSVMPPYPSLILFLNLFFGGISGGFTDTLPIAIGPQIKTKSFLY